MRNLIVKAFFMIHGTRITVYNFYNKYNIKVLSKHYIIVNDRRIFILSNFEFKDL